MRPSLLAAAVGLAALLPPAAVPGAGVLPHAAWQSPDPAESLAFSPDGRTLAVGSLARVNLLSTESGRVVGRIEQPRCLYQEMHYSSDGRRLLAGRQDCFEALPGEPGVVRLWSESGAYAGALRYHRNRLQAVSFDRSGERIASVSADGELKIWNTNALAMESLQRLPVTGRDRRFETPFRLSPDLGVLAVRDWRDLYMSLVDVQTGALLHRTEYPFRDDQPVFAFSPDGARYFDGQRVRGSRDGSLHFTLPADESRIPVRSVFSPDGAELALLSASPGPAPRPARAPRISPERLHAFYVEVYRIADGQLLARADFAEQIRSLAFAPDGQSLALGAWSGRIFLWPAPGTR